MSFTFTHMCIHYWATSPALLFWFCWRENIRDNNKNIAFFLVWDKDSYTERFLVLLPCTCVLQPTLVHLYQTTSLLLSSLPIVASASLRLLYSLLCSEHINHIQFQVSILLVAHLSSKHWALSLNLSTEPPEEKKIKV
jgi:hypothetical protein